MPQARELINLPDWVEIVEADVRPGAHYWRLVKAEFLDEDRSGGRHHIDIVEPHDPSQRVVIHNQQTGEKASVALDKPDSEPATNFPMWRIPNRYAAYMEGLPSDSMAGMDIHGNRHVVYRLWFEKAIKENGTKPDGDIDEDDAGKMRSLNEALVKQAERRQIIRFNPNAALQKVIFRDGFVPNSPEFQLDFEGITYIAQRAERLEDGRVRVYYCEDGDFANVRFVRG